MQIYWRRKRVSMAEAGLRGRDPRRAKWERIWSPEKGSTTVTKMTPSGDKDDAERAGKRVSENEGTHAESVSLHPR